MKIINQNDTSQDCSPTDSNNISAASWPLQTDERNVAKELILDPSYSSDIILDYLEDNILLTNPTEIENGIDVCQGNNHEQEPRYNNQMITKISNMNKETVRLLLAPAGWICLELLNLLLAQTGMKYPDVTEIGKGAMIMLRKPSDIAWKSKNVYRFLR